MPVEFDLPYAAPELVQAARGGTSHMAASTATDMFGVGVIAWELLTHEPVFGPHASVDLMESTLAGVHALPWEAPLSNHLTAKLHGLRRSVLKCLSRAPAERPSSRELLGAWNGLFEAHTGTTRGEFSRQLQADDGS